MDFFAGLAERVMCLHGRGRGRCRSECRRGIINTAVRIFDRVPQLGPNGLGQYAVHLFAVRRSSRALGLGIGEAVGERGHCRLDPVDEAHEAAQTGAHLLELGQRDGVPPCGVADSGDERRLSVDGRDASAFCERLRHLDDAADDTRSNGLSGLSIVPTLVAWWMEAKKSV